MRPSRFEGFYGQVGAGYEGTGFSILNVVDTLPASSCPPNGASISRPNPSINHSNGFAGSARLGYTIAYMGPFLFSISAQYSSISQSALAILRWINSSLPISRSRSHIRIGQDSQIGHHYNL